MSETSRGRMAWIFVALVLISGAILFVDLPGATASDDHDRARMLRDHGEILPLGDILQHPELHGARILEAELESKDGRLVYELELLDPDGRVRERYFDAATGQPFSRVKDKGWKH